MSEKPIKVPSPDHPITITDAPTRVLVTVAGKIIADTRAAKVLREASYPPVFYIPRADLDLTLVMRTDHTSYCPYKGDASYYSIPIGGERSKNAIWSYETPHAAVAQIAGHVAFYPDRIDGIEERPA
jgi:uncharacterized protein (DUF427 family)